MPKRVPKDKIRKVILSQEKTFTPNDIAYQCQVSSATAYMMIREMVEATKEVVIDHKDGKKIIYALNEQKAADKKENSVSRNILDIPVVDRFEYVSGITDMVINKISPSALITGLSGVGKTYLVKKCFAKAGMEEDMDYHFVTGHSSPLGLYRFLYEHRTSICVFDDCDSVFKDEISVNLLKSALDSYDRRTIHWQSSRIPDDLESSFDFTGSIIFISNLDESRIDEAIKSRTFVINLQLTRKEIVEYMRSIVNKIEPKISKEIKLEVIDYLDKTKDHYDQFNLRTLIKVARLRINADKTKMDWKKMAIVID
jgi:uncharacterized protein YlaN (UPF0358 family)